MHWLDNNDSMVDSSAEINVCPQSHGKQTSSTSKTKINPSYDSNINICVLGKCIASVDHKNTILPVMFNIADTNSQTILGADNCEKL